MQISINGTLTTTPNFEQVDALTRTELEGYLTDDLLMNVQEVRGMTRAKMVSTLWKVLAPVAQEEVMVAETPVVTKEKKVANRNMPKPCKCECGEFTKGGTFRPGHDARYYARLHRSAEIGVGAFLPPTLNPNEMALIATA